ncbi:MAG: BamA/TamA family outer membrane protein, partial [Candidatus Marinimicrobia bacterium]|nr:BamA/TamA family outer membrane protein [Candidatus Neomarinimicrobiota bacterium]
HELIKWDSGFGLTVQTPIGRARLDFAFPMYQPESPQIQLGVQNLF